MRKRSIGLFLAVTALVATPKTMAQYCNFPPKEIAQGQHREYRGAYENKTYGYSVAIPSDLVGYDGENPLYQQGFGILLGAEPQSYLFVNGEKNSLEFARPSDAALQLLTYLGKDGNTVESSKVTETQLGSLKAAFLVATYTCPGSTQRYTAASIVAISPDKSNLYEMTLYARSDRFEQDRAILDTLAKSWKLLRT